MEVLTWIGLALAILIIMVILYWYAQWTEQAFCKKWPAIDDDEFLRRCPSGTKRSTAIKVRRIVSKQLGIPYEHVHPDQSFVDDLGCG